MDESSALLSVVDPQPESSYRRVLKADASLWQCIANVSQNVLGTGGLAMPAVFANAGLSGGVFALVVTAAIATFTLTVLGWLTFLTGSRDMQQLVIIVLGKRASKVNPVCFGFTFFFSFRQTRVFVFLPQRFRRCWLLDSCGVLVFC
jgi:hypothetical protein